MNSQQILDKLQPSTDEKYRIFSNMIFIIPEVLIQTNLVEEDKTYTFTVKLAFTKKRQTIIDFNLEEDKNENN